MLNTPEGTFAILASGIAGSSVLVLLIENGQVRGNDSAGAHFKGTVYEHDAKHLMISIDITLRLDTFCVWGTSTAETEQSRQFNEIIPKSIFEGHPHMMTIYDLTIAATRLPDDYRYLAEVGGLEKLIIGTLRGQGTWPRAPWPSQTRHTTYSAAIPGISR